MSASPSSVPAVKAALLALFKGKVEPQTEVWGARPNEDHQQAENVYLGKTLGSRRYVTLPATAPKSRQEDYQVRVEVEVYREGTDYEGAEARAWAIGDALEVAVAEEPTLGLGFIQKLICTNFEQDTPTGTDGVLAKYVFSVEVTARI